MRALEAVEQDAMQFLTKVDELKMNDRRELLMALFQKHIVLNEAEIVLDKFDFDVIVGLAKQLYVQQSLPVRIGDSTLINQEATTLMIVEATIELLNSKGALKRVPKFNRR